MDRKTDRHEIKYSVSVLQAELLKTRLGALLRPDPHVRPDGSYFIRSIYFDDPDFTAYNEKLAGVKERTKYRIRFYNHDDSVIFLERKSKDGDFSGKDSVPLTRAQAAVILGRSMEGGRMSADLSFPDAAEIPAWAVSYISELCFMGVMRGDGTRLDPNGYLTRAQAAKLLTELT